MNRRLNYTEAAPAAFRALLALSNHTHESGLDRVLLDLVYLRVSQMNGCAYCIDMHAKDLRAAGVAEQRLDLLPAFREAPVYSDRERAALAWAEAVTELGKGAVPDALYEEVREHFKDDELVELTLAVGVINTWNRMNIAFRTPAGNYVPPKAR